MARVPSMEVTTHVAHLEDAGRRLADAAARTELTAPVPSCPGWSLRELVRHTGAVHQWATTHVRDRPADVIRRPLEELVGGWPADDDLLDWYRRSHAELVATLRGAPADLDCATFLAAPSPLAMWARRQAHEATIHRVDAQLAAGDVSRIDAELAADGIDELLTCFITRPGRGPRRDEPAVLAVRPTDVDVRWSVRLSDGDVEVARPTPGPDGHDGHDEPAPDTVVAGPAAALYLLLWNRAERGELARDGQLTVGGDASLLDHWRTEVRVRMR